MKKRLEDYPTDAEVTDDIGQLGHLRGFKPEGETWWQRNAIVVAALGYVAATTTLAAIETAILLRDRDNSQTA